MMRIVFWQNILSPHQLPYIARLMDDERVDEVVVAAGQEMTSERKDMGWSVGNYPGLERCKIFVRPDDATINSLLAARTEDSWHLFSGIHADPFVFKCLETSMDYPPHEA